MTVDEQLVMLARMTELSQLMLENALLQKWESVINMQTVRQGLIQAFFADEMQVDPQVIADSIQKILLADEQLISLSMDERNDLASQLKKMSRGKGAVKAYTS